MIQRKLIMRVSVKRSEWSLGGSVCIKRWTFTVWQKKVTRVNYLFNGVRRLFVAFRFGGIFPAMTACHVRVSVMLSFVNTCCVLQKHQRETEKKSKTPSADQVVLLLSELSCDRCKALFMGGKKVLYPSNFCIPLLFQYSRWYCHDLSGAGSSYSIINICKNLFLLFITSLMISIFPGLNFSKAKMKLEFFFYINNFF